MNNNLNLLLISLFNLSNYEANRIFTINNDNTISFYVRLNRMIKICPICGCLSIKSTEYYKRNIHLPNYSFKESCVYLEIHRYICNSYKSSFSDVLLK